VLERVEEGDLGPDDCENAAEAGDQVRGSFGHLEVLAMRG